MAERNPKQQSTTRKKAIRMKMIAIGNAGVGKTCIIKRFCEKRFVPKYLPTIGIDFGASVSRSAARDIRVNIFDMSGDAVFYDVRNDFYRETQGAFLVFDVTDSYSFDALDTWLSEMRREMGGISELEHVTVILLANKTESPEKRVIEESEGRLWADLQGFKYFEVSAMSGTGIMEAFEALFAGVLDRVQDPITADHNRGTFRPDTASKHTKEQFLAISQVRNGKDPYEKLGLRRGATREEVTRAYRRLAILLHPDKNSAPGAEEAFKMLGSVRDSLLEHAYRRS